MHTLERGVNSYVQDCVSGVNTAKKKHSSENSDKIRHLLHLTRGAAAVAVTAEQGYKRTNTRFLHEGNSCAVG